MAPVTGGVADAQKDRDVASFGILEGVASPRVPVDGIVRVLQEIGGFAAGEAIRAAHAAAVKLKKHSIYRFRLISTAHD